MREDASRLKQQIPLLDYLQRHHWAARPIGSQREFVGLCPLHSESRPSFYVNTHKNLFYCHGCGRGGDLIRFVQLYFRLSFLETVALLKQELAPASESEVLNQTAAFYQSQLHRHPEATQYLSRRGVHDHGLIQQLEIGYAPGGTLRRILECARLLLRSVVSECGAMQLQRLEPAQQFRHKGTGWYETDFKKDGKKRLVEGSHSSDSGDDKPAAETDKAAKPEKPGSRKRASRRKTRSPPPEPRPLPPTDPGGCRAGGLRPP